MRCYEFIEMYRGTIDTGVGDLLEFLLRLANFETDIVRPIHFTVSNKLNAFHA